MSQSKTIQNVLAIYVLGYLNAQQEVKTGKLVMIVCSAANKPKSCSAFLCSFLPALDY